MSNNKVFQKDIAERLERIAVSLSQTGRNSQANMVFFPIESPYNILKIKDWLSFKQGNISISIPDRSWYSLDDASKELQKIQLKQTVKDICDKINERILNDVMEIGSLKKDSFKAEPNGKR